MESYTYIEDIVETLEDNYKNLDQIHLVEPLIKQILNQELAVHSKESGELIPFDSLLEQLSMHKSFLLFKEDIMMKDLFFKEIESLQTDWKCYSDEENRLVYTKSEEGQSILSIYFRAKIPTNLYYPVYILSQPERFKEWIPYIAKSDLISNATDFRKVLHVERQLHWPVVNRDLVICASSYLVQERKGVMFILRSMNEEREKLWGVKSPPYDYNTIVRAECIKGYQYVEEIDKDNCYFHGLMNIDPILKFIPDFFVNFTIKRLMYTMMGQIASRELFESFYKNQKANGKQEFYDKVKALLREYVQIPDDEEEGEEREEEKEGSN